MALIYHPDLGHTKTDPVEVPDRHFENVWAERGWLLADGEPPVDGPAPPARSASKSEWEAYAVDQGLTPENAHGATKDELIARFGG